MADGPPHDVLVIGGGSAGCVLAARLSEDPGRRVCLVEAGPDYGAQSAGRRPADMLDARWLAFSHAWETDREDRSQLRARIIGGCSAHNACIVIAGEPAYYDEWGEGDRVLLDGDRAIGVATSRGDIGARLVVLAAGAYGSPGILLRSGIGPDRGLPVGEGLTDHVGVGFAFDATAALQRETAAFEAGHDLCMGQVSIRVSSRACPAGLHDVFLFPAMDPLGPEGYPISAAVFAMKPSSRGSVRLNAPDPRTPLAVDHGFLSDPSDVEVLVDGVEALRLLAATGPVLRYAVRETRPGPQVAAVDHVRATARGFFHPVGTCAIGRVVDGAGRVLGVEGLHVADASIMPTIPRANTNLSTIAIAERIAETALAAA